LEREFQRSGEEFEEYKMEKVYKKPPIFTREEINKLNWSELIDYAMRIGKFAKRTSVKRRRIWGV